MLHKVSSLHHIFLHLPVISFFFLLSFLDLLLQEFFVVHNSINQHIMVGTLEFRLQFLEYV